MADDIEKIPSGYQTYAGFVMAKTNADCVVLTVLGGKDGSGSVLTVTDKDFVTDVVPVLEMLIKEIREKILNQQTN
jgi:hypothetical protein